MATLIVQPSQSLRAQKKNMIRKLFTKFNNEKIENNRPKGIMMKCVKGLVL